jgi:hypothetical protein
MSKVPTGFEGQQRTAIGILRNVTSEGRGVLREYVHLPRGWLAEFLAEEQGSCRNTWHLYGYRRNGLRILREVFPRSG